MKTYVLMVSRTFMKSHPRAWQQTHFEQKIMLTVKEKELPLTINGEKYLLNVDAHKTDIAFQEGWQPKIHTIRHRYDYWARVAEEVNAGRGILSLRQWTGSPYNYARDGSKQQEFLRLEKMSVQKAEILREQHEHHAVWTAYVDGRLTSIDKIAQNDGLLLGDFLEWFRKAKPEPMALINFTDFKY
jgi:hypothetical protein